MTGIEVAKGGVSILRGVDISVADGEILGIVGPSGSGKSTLLEVAAGTVKPDKGEVSIGGFDVTLEEPAARNVAMVFQDSVMYPMRSVARNVGFPLQVQHRPRTEIAKRVTAEGRALHLEHLMDRDPSELSAGHQQLVQIARALVRAPSVFLMDEPLARLDAHLRVDMRAELRTVQRGYGVTMLYVTNDPDEAMAMSDTLAVLIDGAIIQTGTPRQVHDRPASLAAAEILGDLSTLRCHVTSDGSGFWIQRGDYRVKVWAPTLEAYVGRDVLVGVRPTQVVPGSAGIRANVERHLHHGSHVVTLCRTDEALISVRTVEPCAPPGAPVILEFHGGHIFDSDSGQTLASW